MCLLLFLRVSGRHQTAQFTNSCSKQGSNLIATYRPVTRHQTTIYMVFLHAPASLLGLNNGLFDCMQISSFSQLLKQRVGLLESGAQGADLVIKSPKL